MWWEGDGKVIANRLWQWRGSGWRAVARQAADTVLTDHKHRHDRVCRCGEVVGRWWEGGC